MYRSKASGAQTMVCQYVVADNLRYISERNQVACTSKPLSLKENQVVE